MKILIVNSGSSSIKLTLFSKDGKSGKLIKKRDILVDRIEPKDYQKILTKYLKDFKDISAIGHRVVHGGEKYKKATKINSQVIKDIKSLFKLAPLHNPPNLEGILACQKIFKNIPQVAVFDTAYYQTIPQKAYIYGLPYNLYTKHHIRRYGFHGTSHKFVVNEGIKMLKKKNAKIVSCHLGNGASITASASGKSADTSMGFTPLEGVIMGTRSGSIDPSIIFHLASSLKMPISKIEYMLNHESGLKGVSQISSDMRDIYGKSLKKNKQAIFTIDLLSYQIAKYIGAYSSILGGIDAIIFTAGLGEKAFYVREKAIAYLSHLGTKIDKNKNRKNNILISDKKSKVKIFVIHTDEAVQIAKETLELI